MGPSLSVSCGESWCCGHVHIHATVCPTSRTVCPASRVVDSFEEIVQTARRLRSGPLSRGELRDGFVRFAAWFPEAAGDADEIIEAILGMKSEVSSKLGVTFDPSPSAPFGAVAFGPSWWKRDLEASKLVQFCTHILEHAMNTSNLYLTGNIEARTSDVLQCVGVDHIQRIRSDVNDLAIVDTRSAKAEALAKILRTFDAAGGVKAVLLQMQEKMSPSDWRMVGVVAGAISVCRLPASTFCGTFHEADDLIAHGETLTEQIARTDAGTLLSSPIASMRKRVSKKLPSA